MYCVHRSTVFLRVRWILMWFTLFYAPFNSKNTLCTHYLVVEFPIFLCNVRSDWTEWFSMTTQRRLLSEWKEMGVVSITTTITNKPRGFLGWNPIIFFYKNLWNWYWKPTIRCFLLLFGFPFSVKEDNSFYFNYQFFFGEGNLCVFFCS